MHGEVSVLSTPGELSNTTVQKLRKLSKKPNDTKSSSTRAEFDDVDMEKFDILVGLQTKLKLFFFPEKDTDACIFLGKIDDAISLPPANSDQSSSVNDQFMLISETADLRL